jgi:hypothetical protein
MKRGPSVDANMDRARICAPKDWFESEGGWQALQNLFEKHFAAVCGMSVIGHTHFGGISVQIRADAAHRIIEEAKRAALDTCR